MQIIPVLDIKDGLVVHARHGRRSAYQPLRSGLCASPAPSEVLRGLLALRPFRTLYIADLNAITGNGDNGSLVMELCRDHRQLTVWLDSGVRDAHGLQRWHGVVNHVPVLASEVITDPAHYHALKGGCAAEPVLSLDYHHGEFRGPPTLELEPALWPKTVIVMDLDRVGAAAGPGLERLARVHTLAPHSEIYAAGGVRNVDDLKSLANMGVAGALIATSLHDGTLGAGDIGSAVNNGPAVMI